MDREPVFIPKSEERSFWGTPFVLVLTALILVVAVAFMATRKDVRIADEANLTNPEEVVVRVTDLSSQEAAERLPEGFPSGIPVETGSVTESIVSDYAARGMTQYTVSYTSTKGPVELFAEYERYMKAEGYEFSPQGIDAERGTLYGTKDNDDLSVVVYAAQGVTGSTVQIAFLDRR
jgi:hypothetical protein